MAGEQASDMEVALFLASHIKSPCVDLSTGKNIREVYLREARRQLNDENFVCPEARNFLTYVIMEYQ